MTYRKYSKKKIKNVENQTSSFTTIFARIAQKLLKFRLESFFRFSFLLNQKSGGKNFPGNFLFSGPINHCYLNMLSDSRKDKASASTRWLKMPRANEKPGLPVFPGRVRDQAANGRSSRRRLVLLVLLVRVRRPSVWSRREAPAPPMRQPNVTQPTLLTRSNY